MAIMKYETPGITGIEFEDNLFVTTEFDKDDNKKIKQYIEQCGGIVKNSVTRSTNYLLYENGEEETVKYKKALELVQEKGLDIIILSRKTFEKLIKMSYKTPDVSGITIDGKQFTTTGATMPKLRKYIEENGGTFDGFAAESTDYLIYENNEWMTAEYRKAVETAQEGSSGIIVLSRNAFKKLITMSYETPDVSEIVIDGKRFATTGSTMSTLRGYIEENGGAFDGFAEESADYLIYEDREWMTKEYREAVAIAQEGNSRTIVLSRETFEKLITMTYETPDVSEIAIDGKRFATTGLSQSDIEVIRTYIEKNGGSVVESAAMDVDYLIYENDKWMTKEYRKAIETTQNEEAGPIVLSERNFIRLISQKYDMEFGSYSFEEDGTPHPIRWRILKREGNKALLFSTYGLDAKRYNERYEGVTWETCSLRRWLNEDFYRTAFTDEEKSRILPTKVKNEDNPQWHTPGGNDTEDRIFLLSSSEAKQYLATWLERVKISTPYAEKSGVWEAGNGINWWWLRSPGLSSYNAALVFCVGVIVDDGYLVHYFDDAVCPALWINLDPEI